MTVSVGRIGSFILFFWLCVLGFLMLFLLKRQWNTPYHGPSIWVIFKSWWISNIISFLGFIFFIYCISPSPSDTRSKRSSTNTSWFQWVMRTHIPFSLEVGCKMTFQEDFRLSRLVCLTTRPFGTVLCWALEQLLDFELLFFF